MKKTKIYLYCLCMAIMMLLMSSNVYGATLKSATVSKTKTYRWDLTHDGKSDSVKFVIAKDNYNMINKLQIHVNGKKAYSISDLYVYFKTEHIARCLSILSYTLQGSEITLRINQAKESSFF